MTFSLFRPWLQTRSTLLLAWFPRATLASLVTASLMLGAVSTAFGSERQRPDLLSQANRAYLRQDYRDALIYYRQHLRANPNDYDAWTLLAATYYHQAQPKRALRLLKKYQRRSSVRSQNFYYQGLAYDAMGRQQAAKRYLKRAMQAKDPFAALAHFELLTIVYLDRQVSEAESLIEQFRANYQDSPLLSSVQQIQADLKARKFIPVEQSQRFQYGLAIYRQHPYSVVHHPHFWSVQVGYFYAQGTRTNPAIDGQQRPIVEEGAGFEETSLNARFSFGIGPIQNRDTTIFMGYQYEQRWLTTRERINTYLDDMLDFSYFPFRPDLQERDHKIFLEASSHMMQKLHLGLYTHLKFVNAGSSLYPAPERPEIKQTLNVSNSFLTAPWIRWQWSDQQSLEFHLLFEKKIDREQSDFSNKTYSILNTDDPFVSFGLRHQTKLLGRKVSITSDLLRYRYLFNDYWEEHYRNGFYTRATWNWRRNWQAFTRLGIYQDEYLIDQIKTNSCSFGTQINGVNDRGVSCKRIDNGLIFQVGMRFLSASTNSWSAYVNFVKHENPELKVYNEDRTEFLVMYSLAFPTVELVSPLINRFERPAIRFEDR